VTIVYLRAFALVTALLLAHWAWRALGVAATPSSALASSRASAATTRLAPLKTPVQNHSATEKPEMHERNRIGLVATVRLRSGQFQEDASLR